MSATTLTPAVSPARSTTDSRAERWVRRGAWLAVLVTTLGLLWVGLTLFHPLPANAATPGAEPAADLTLSTPSIADAPSARSTR